MNLGKIILLSGVAFLFFIFVSCLTTHEVSAHCDTLDGPVVNAARKALKTENVNYVLFGSSQKTKMKSGKP
jgi:hypothetical protein